MALIAKYLSPILASAVMLILSACSGGEMPVYSSFVDIPAKGWSADEYCDFPTAEKDSTLFADPSRRYDVIFVVRHADDYPFSDLYLGFTSTPKAAIPQSVKINLAARSGEWYGTGMHGLITVNDTIARNIPLPRLLNIKITQEMRRELIPGIISAGIIITQAKK